MQYYSLRSFWRTNILCCVCVFFLLFAAAACKSPRTAKDVPEHTPEQTELPSVDEELPPEQTAEAPIEIQNTEAGADAIGFKEVWTYVLHQHEHDLHKRVRVSDVGYFGATVNYRGELAAVPDARKLSAYPARVHLVVTCENYGMTHMVLSPEYPLRAKFIRDLVQNARDKGYDGIQIDFEMVHSNDKDIFLSFLKDLKTAAKADSGKNTKNLIMSVAFPARTKKLTKDAYDYETASAIVDRFFVMAYDEHWSRSKPGPVASFDWCRNVARYALSAVPVEKLIMGQPFYGRTWGTVSANRAFFFSGIERQIKEFNITDIKQSGGVSTFSYTTQLNVTGFFDTAHSLAARSRMYKEMGVLSTGFWRLGQEDPDVWNFIYVQSPL